MSEKSMQATIILRHGSEKELSEANPVLLKGEMCVETDTFRFKFGDGNRSWNELPYANSFSLKDAENELVELEIRISELEKSLETIQ